MKGYGHILSAFAAEAWAMHPAKMDAVLGFLELKCSGGIPEADAKADIVAAAQAAQMRAEAVSASSGGSVAVLPLFGLIMPRGNMVGNISGPRGTSIEQFTASLEQAVNDPGTRAVVIVVDSPGGAVAGVSELATKIQAWRKQKTIIAISEYTCASAAYWIASACSEIYVSPSSLTGSIGVYMVHKDVSKALETAGIKVTMIQHGENKTAGNEAEPLSDSAREDLQATVTYMGQQFERDVAKGRKVKAADVPAKFGAGKMFNAQKAVSSGMADKIGTLDDVLARFGVSRSPGGSSARAEGGVPALALAAAAPVAAAKCQCPCAACVDGDCDGCTDDDCSFEGCTCDASASARNSKAQAALRAAEYEARENELLLASLA